MQHLIRTLALLAATPLMAEDMRPQETQRLAAYHATAGQALLDALSGGSRGDVDQLQEVLSGAPIPPLETTLAGDWSCRTLKLGGLRPLTVYAPFQCRITPDGTAFQFEKLTGSQRTIGTIALRDGQMIYLGTGFVADATPIPYADLPADFAGDGTIKPQVGVVEQTGPDTARILFPAPVNESLLDILYLTR